VLIPKTKLNYTANLKLALQDVGEVIQAIRRDQTFIWSLIPMQSK